MIVILINGKLIFRFFLINKTLTIYQFKVENANEITNNKFD